MLCSCVECGRKIASDAGRCPYCGTREAGERASTAAALQSYYSQPDWREKEQAREAQHKASMARFDTLFMSIWLLIVAIGGSIGVCQSGFFGMLGGMFLAVIVGWIPTGMIAVLFDDGD